MSNDGLLLNAPVLAAEPDVQYRPDTFTSADQATGSTKGDRRRPLWLMPWLISAFCVGLSALVLHTIEFNPLSPLASALSEALVYITGGTALLLVVLLRRRNGVWPHVVVAAMAYLTSTLLIIGLAGTPYGLGGTQGDLAFRSLIMTRYSLTWLPVDYSYRGHGAFMPPLWYWVAGRLADIAGVVGWQAMKWAQITSAFLVPAVALLFWRRVVGLRVGAVVAIVGTLAMPDAVRGDEWLALTILLPWWLDAFGDVQSPDVRRLPAWLHGIFAGLLLLLYTGYFLSAGVATIVVAVVAAQRRCFGYYMRRWSVLVAVGLTVWSPVWVPAIYERLTGPPFQLFQLRWFGVTYPTEALIRLSAIGLLMMAGVVTLGWYARDSTSATRTSPLGLSAPQAHGIFVASILVVLSIGLVLTALDIPILVFKTYPLLRYGLATAGAAGLCWLVIWLVRVQPRVARQVKTTAALLCFAFGTALGLQYVTVDARDTNLLAAYQAPRIDGQVSRYSDRPSTLASAQDVLTALGPKVDQTVLSVRYDIFFFGGYWSWLQSAPNYAHPHTQYLDRIDYMEKMAVAASSRELASMMTENPYGRIDALVLRDVGGRLIWAYRRNDFPRGSTRVEIEFNRQLIDDIEVFRVTQLDGYVVIRPR